MSTIPPLPEAASLSGAWTVREEGGAGRTCRLVLHDQQVVGGHRLEAEPDCLPALALPGVVGWRPAPDGVALIDAEQLSVAFFSREASRRYVARRPGGRVLVLAPGPTPAGSLRPR